MGLFDLFSTSKQDFKYCHLKNLILLANADNKISNEEINVITEVMKRENLTEENFKQAVDELKHEKLLGNTIAITQKVKVIPPPTKEKALVYLQDMVALMLIDGYINDKEKEFGKNIAQEFGYKSSIIDLMIPFVLKKAKDLSNNIENKNITPSPKEEDKLFNIAKQGVIFIDENFKQLSSKGYNEAMIFCSIFLVNMGTPHSNTLDMDSIEDRYFLLLYDYIFDNNIDVIPFIDSRINFYQSEFKKLRSSPVHSPMFIYNTFYMNPYTKNPRDLHEFYESPVTLLKMQEILYKTISYMDKLKH